ncbi:3-keto-5-aminohexanoate cleavage protein, partial [Candidatus Pelagibacter sp.]|nr:3-keto-5-aminohexanoate cleavage protein [Candidatus Pelagibacter sp.]
MSFYQPAKLPRLMVAPNGARKVKKDHPAVPLTISETVVTAKSCYEAGAGAIHLHVRDKDGQHVLDAGLYKEALNELEHQVPKMHIQVTTEAIGKYSPADMRKLAYDVTPPGTSIGTSELIPSRKPEEEDIKLYKYLTEAGTKIQHILYKPEDIDLLIELLNKA